jgi:hypothetical protein
MYYDTNTDGPEDTELRRLNKQEGERFYNKTDNTHETDFNFKYGTAHFLIEKEKNGIHIEFSLNNKKLGFWKEGADIPWAATEINRPGALYNEADTETPGILHILTERRNIPKPPHCLFIKQYDAKKENTNTAVTRKRARKK